MLLPSNHSKCLVYTHLFWIEFVSLESNFYGARGFLLAAYLLWKWRNDCVYTENWLIIMCTAVDNRWIKITCSSSSQKTRKYNIGLLINVLSAKRSLNGEAMAQWIMYWTLLRFLVQAKTLSAATLHRFWIETVNKGDQPID